MANTTKPTELEVQTQHVYEVALSNLNIVIDQLQSLNDAKVDTVLECLDGAKSDLSNLVG